MNILITGGAGYVGSLLTSKLLAKGHKVRVLDSLLHGGESLLSVWTHPNFEFRNGDIRDFEAVKSAVADMDGVVHLAAIVGDPACARQPGEARAVNLDASLNLISECRRLGVRRFVFASTCSNYGRMADSERYVDETSELRPISLYAETKVGVEREVLNGHGDRMCATLLRFATIFGVSPRMRFDLTVNEFTASLISKKHLVVFGEQFWRPYIHVGDAARAIELVLESPEDKVSREVFNVGSSSENYQKQQLVELMKPYAPGAVVEFVHKNEDPRDYRVAFDKIRNQLGFEISTTVRQGIEEIAQLFKNGVIENFEDPRYRN